MKNPNSFKFSRRKLLSAALPTAAAAVVTTVAPSVHAGVVQSFNDGFTGTWRNWAGNISFIPKKVKRPKSLEELQEVIKGATKVRLVGSGHSFSALVQTEDTLIDIGHLDKILFLDAEKKQITVEGGLVLSRLNKYLAGIGYALPNMGDIDKQTVAGLVSTGTHGTGISFGSFSDESSLVGMQIVLQDGRLLKLDATNSENENLMKAARLSLGSLGAIYSVTLQLVDAFNIHYTSNKADLSEALKPEHYLNNDYYKFWYFPFTNTAALCIANKTKEAVNADPVQADFRETFTENFLTDKIFRFLSVFRRQTPFVARKLASLFPNEDYIDKSYRVLVSKRTMKVYDMAYAVPVEKTAQAMQILKQKIDELAKADIFFAHIPVHVRFLRSDQGNLMSYSQGSSIVSVIEISSHTSVGGYKKFFQEIEDAFLDLGGRPHWGKIFYKNPGALYEKRSEFAAIQKQLDPQGKFLNQLVTKILAD